MAIDISEYLRVVKNGTTVNEVRTAISGAVDKLRVYLNAKDINQELYDIQHGVYGRDIRGAIYSALEKLSQKEGGGNIAITDNFESIITDTLIGEITTAFNIVIVSTYQLSDYDFGYVAPSDYTGAMDAELSGNRVGTRDYIPVDSPSLVGFLTDTSELDWQYFCYLYDSNKDYLSGVSSFFYDWTNCGVRKNGIRLGAQYVRIGFRVPDNRSIDISTIQSSYMQYV